MIANFTAPMLTAAGARAAARGSPAAAARATRPYIILEHSCHDNKSYRRKRKEVRGRAIVSKVAANNKLCMECML